MWAGLNPLLGNEFEIRCEPGEDIDTTGICEIHHTHTWCVVCQGFYGVSHDRIHWGHNAHPYGNSDWTQCVCRPCTGRRVDAEDRRRGERS